MPGLDDILRTVANAADMIDDFVPGANIATNVLRGAQGLASAFDNFKAANGGTAPPDAQAVRDGKLARVLEHARSTADRLDPDGAG